MKLSIIVPTIRPENLRALHESTANAINGRYEWEMVAIGPRNENSFGFVSYTERFLQDDGSPCHCQQRALLHCQGDYVTWAADDGIWLPGSLDRDWDDDAILCKYMEGRPNWDDDRWQGMDPKLRRDVQSYSRGEVGLNPDMVALDSFWTIGYHKGAQVSGASPDSQLLCLGIIKRSLLLDVGGWDEGYETAAQATVDLGLRLQACGTKFTLWSSIVQALGYDPKAERTALNAAYDADMQRYKILWEGGSRGRLPIGPDADKPQQWARRVAK